MQWLPLVESQCNAGAHRNSDFFAFRFRVEVKVGGQVGLDRDVFVAGAHSFPLVVRISGDVVAGAAGMPARG
jgi:hypothetical protein